MADMDLQAAADAAEHTGRITGAELIEVISKHPDWLNLPVQLLNMTDDAVWLTEIERDCFDPNEGFVLSLVAGAPAIAEPLVNPRPATLPVADAAERVQAAIDAHVAAARPSAHVLYAIPDPNRPRGWLHLMEPDLRVLLADRVQMAAELEQVRGNADEFRACRDNAVAQGDAFEAEARELAQALITAHAKNKRLLDRATAAKTELEQVRDALTVAAELIDRLAFDDKCDLDHHGYCQAHNLHSMPCPHPLGRQFVETWRAAQPAEDAEATS